MTVIAAQRVGVNPGLEWFINPLDRPNLRAFDSDRSRFHDHVCTVSEHHALSGDHCHAARYKAFVR
ncbi:MAG: hypothetical protein AAFV29_24355, partial [Myxococcota bacterium]